MKRVTLNFDDHTVAQLDIISEQDGLPRIVVIREIVEEHIRAFEQRALARLPFIVADQTPCAASVAITRDPKTRIKRAAA